MKYFGVTILITFKATYCIRVDILHISINNGKLTENICKLSETIHKTVNNVDNIDLYLL